MVGIRNDAGAASSLRAGLGAGAVCGLVFGLADGIVAGNLDGVHASALALAGCVAATVFQYTLLAMAGLAVLGLLLHPFLRRLTPSRRHLLLLRVGLTAGAFAELYWWSRPYVFYGRAATSLPRLLATFGMLLAASAVGWIAAAALARAPERTKRVAAVLAVVA